MGIAEQIRSELENLTHYPDLFNELANATNSPQNGTYAATVARICMLTVQGPCSLCNVISSHWVGGVIENPYAKPFVGSTVSVDFAYPGISDSTAILPRQPYIGTWYGTFTYGPGIVLQC
jgi:hypothetical protein